VRKPVTLFELQVGQKEHDARHHGDIYSLPMFAKLNHYVLHYAKYVPRLTRKDQEVQEQLKRTYTDAFLISLSASNALNMDLETSMKVGFGTMTRDISEYTTGLKVQPLDKIRVNSRDILAIATGAMADTMEKRDHLDDINSRSVMTTGVEDITKMILEGSHQISFDIVQATLDRRANIAKTKVA